MSSLSPEERELLLSIAKDLGSTPIADLELDRGHVGAVVVNGVQSRRDPEARRVTAKAFQPIPVRGVKDKHRLPAEDSGDK
jgi:hypothetical protein